MRAVNTSPVGGGGRPGRPGPAAPGPEFEFWRSGVRQRALAHVAEFVQNRCLPQLTRTGVEVTGDVLTGLRRRQMPAVDLHVPGLAVRWKDRPDPSGRHRRRCRRPAGLSRSGVAARVRVAAGRRHGRFPRCGVGGPRRTYASDRWHRENGLSGSPERFWRLAGDPALRSVPGLGRANDARQRVPAEALARPGCTTTPCGSNWPSDKCADVANDAGALPTLDAVLDVARRKSATTRSGGRWRSVRRWRVATI